MPDHTRPPFTPIADPPAEALAAARARFEAGEAHLPDLAREFGMAVSTLRKRMVQRWGWRLPQPQGKRRTPRSTAGQARKRLGGNLRVMLKRELAKLENEFASLPPDGDIERTTRVLANLVRTLVALARLDGAPARKPVKERDDRAADASADVPQDLARLRDDLARRLGATGEPAGDAADPAEPAAS